MANWSFKDPGDAIKDGSTIESGNFTQLALDTPIMVGKPLTITGGNWTNVRKDKAWTVTGGNWTQIDRCSHLHPEWVAKGLPECAENCKHVTEVNTIEIDGQVIDMIYSYEDKLL